MRIAIVATTALALLSACDKPADKAAAPTEQAAKAAGEDTIGSGIAKGSKFAAAAKAAGLDATLPVRVLIPCWCPPTPPSTSFPPARSTR